MSATRVLLAALTPQVLMEVAASVQHLHNMQLLHCDIKPENVLLKSDNSNPLGFTTKLSDFGLAKLLRDNYYIINRSGSGTVTHLAPELFQVSTGVCVGGLGGGGKSMTVTVGASCCSVAPELMLGVQLVTHVVASKSCTGLTVKPLLCTAVLDAFIPTHMLMCPCVPVSAGWQQDHHCCGHLQLW